MTEFFTPQNMKYVIIYAVFITLLEKNKHCFSRNNLVKEINLYKRTAPHEHIMCYSSFGNRISRLNILAPHRFHSICSNTKPDITNQANLLWRFAHWNYSIYEWICWMLSLLLLFMCDNIIDGCTYVLSQW